MVEKKRRENSDRKKDEGKKMKEICRKKTRDKGWWEF